MHPWEKLLTGLHFGTIEKVVPPSDDKNESKTQYEYEVNITIDRFASIPVKCILMDRFGGWYDEYEDRILTAGTSVFVMMPRGNRVTGVIIGMPRMSTVAQTEPTGKPLADPPYSTASPGFPSSRRYEKYFLNFTETYEKNTTLGEWTFKHDLGPFIKVEGTKVTISNGATETITIGEGSVTVEAVDAKIDAKKSVEVKALGGDINVTATIGNVNVKANEVKVNCKTVDVKCKDAKIVANKVDIKALSGIDLNKILGGMVLTTMTQPTCYVSGIPFKGVPNVKAG